MSSQLSRGSPERRNDASIGVDTQYFQRIYADLDGVDGERPWIEEAGAGTLPS